MDKNLSTKTNEVINRQSQQLSVEIHDKLKQARQLALEQKESKPFLFTAWYLPVAATVLFALYFALMPQLENRPAQPISVDDYAIIQDIDMIEDMELIEDLEFYQWLSQEDELTSI